MIFRAFSARSPKFQCRKFPVFGGFVFKKLLVLVELLFVTVGKLQKTQKQNLIFPKLQKLSKKIEYQES